MDTKLPKLLATALLVLVIAHSAFAACPDFPVAPAYSVGGIRPVSTVMADFNGDGDLDLAVANYHEVAILPGHGDGTFAAAMTIGATSRSAALAAGDLNGDGRPDLAVVNEITATVTVLLHSGAGLSFSASHYAVASGPTGLAIGDVSGERAPRWQKAGAALL